jgi:vesicle-associated membrane protein 7
MTIVYALVSREKTVLSEYSAQSATGNFPTVTRVLLSKIPPEDGRQTYVYDQYLFHYVVESGICFLCMSDELNKHRIPYAFLNDIKDRFQSKYGREEPLHAIAFAYNEEFARTIQERMEFFNSEEADRTIDSLGAVKSQIDDVKGVMVQNIERVLERGEKLELLVERTDRLNQQAFRFEASSRSLRRTMYWKQMRCRIGAGCGVAFLIFILVATACGGLDFHKCRHHD